MIDISDEQWSHVRDDVLLCMGHGVLGLLGAFGDPAPTEQLEAWLDVYSARIRWCAEHGGDLLLG